jgi:ADP-ribose pyrophosphatase YjhB (NUDIX family)
MQNNMQNNISYGIALCRNNIEKNNQTEIIMIKRRYTYHYWNFIMAKYNKIPDDAYLRYLFNNMAFNEKIDILGMHFGNMWYRIWLNNPEIKFNIVNMYSDTQKTQNKLECPLNDIQIHKLFYRKKEKFEKNFKKDDGKKLRNLINNSKTQEILWEIPKGKKKDGETEIDCATREFYEETGIDPSKYDINFHTTPIIETLKDNDIYYRNIYFMATPKKNINISPYVNLNNLTQIIEISQIKWVGINDIQFFNIGESPSRQLISLYKQVIKKYRNSKKMKFIK